MNYISGWNLAIDRAIQVIEKYSKSDNKKEVVELLESEKFNIDFNNGL